MLLDPFWECNYSLHSVPCTHSIYHNWALLPTHAVGPVVVQFEGCTVTGVEHQKYCLHTIESMKTVSAICRLLYVLHEVNGRAVEAFRIVLWLSVTRGSTVCHLVLHIHVLPRWSDLSPKGKCRFCLGSITYLLDVTPSNSLPHPLPPPPIPVCLKFKCLDVKQHLLLYVCMSFVH